MNNFAGQWLWFFDDQLVHSLLNVQPDDPRLARRAASNPSVVVAMRLWMERLPEEALQELAAPVRQSDHDAMALAGQILFEMGKVEEAAQLFAKLAAIFPGHPFAGMNLGLCQARMRAWAEAAENLKNALALHPDRAEVWFALGVALVNQKRATEARSAFTRSLRLNSEYAPAWFGQGIACQLEGNHAEALRIYDKLLEAQPDREELLANAVVAAAELRDSAKIRLLAPRLLQLNPKSTHARLALSWIALEQGNLEEANKHCAMVAQANPGDYRHWYNLGVCLLRLGQPEKAGAAFDNAARLQPDDAGAAEGLARSLTAVGRAEDARKAWERVLRLAPDREEAWFRFGLLLYEAGEHSEASAAFDRCVRFRPDWLDAWSNLGNARWSSGDFAGAVTAFQRVLDASPFHSAARRAMAALAVDTGNLTEAERYIEGLSGKDWEILYNLAMLFHSSGKLQRAAALYREVLATKPDFTEARFNLGSVLFGLGRVMEGQDSWKAAVAMKPELAGEILKWMGNGPLCEDEPAAV
ncbi:MAG: tetratricopeptide repeat protein [Bryobacterales bacterium]|nr:tetratricopeptide repeat protein [Bryobacterales bacterium]